MIDLATYVRNPVAPRVFVNAVGGIYRVDASLIETVFIIKSENLTRNPVEQVSLIWPVKEWYAHIDMMSWIQREISQGAFDSADGLLRRAH